MRDLLLGVVILSMALYALRAPWIGIMGWTWVSMMNPHAYSYRLNDLPVAAIFAATTLIGMVASRDKKTFFATRETVVLMMFMGWMCVTLPFSFYFDESFELWKRVMKIDFMLLVTLTLLYTRKHILAFTWVVAGSIAFYGVKGGIFTLATGGSHRVWGPAGGYIEGNNELALALVMTIPLLRFLQTTVNHRWGKHALTASMLLCAVAALGSQSRGALLAILAMATVMWWRSDRRMIGLVILPVIGIAMVSFMPESWWTRMETIGSYKEDGSAVGRLNAWIMAWNLATHNFFGGGFMVTKSDLFTMFSPDPLDVHAAHSIYFMVLGEHGFVGLALFLVLFFLVWLSAGRLRLQSRKLPETQWLSELGAMCQVSLAGYAVGGAFLSLSYYDLPYNILGLVVLGCRWMDTRAWLKDDKPITPDIEGVKLKRT